MLVGRETPHGGDIYHHDIELDFSANVNPLGMPDAVIEAVRRAAGNLAAYPDPYCTKLTAAIAEAEQVPQETVICGNGAADLIFSWCLACRPKRALLLAPTFSEYEQALKTVDCEIDYFALARENGFAVTEEILARITAETDAVFLCNPNNPTGVLTEKELLITIADRCQEMGTKLFLDECFNDLIDEPWRYTMKDKLDEYPELFILKAFTKLYGMAGVRLGYGLCADRALLEKMGHVSQSWNVSTVAQTAGVAALACTDFVEKTKALVQREREYLTKELTALGITVWPGSANYLMISSEKPLYYLLLERKILIRSCANYRGLGEGDFRIAVRGHEENQQLVENLREILKR